jgi:hypothetical protein
MFMSRQATRQQWMASVSKAGWRSLMKLLYGAFHLAKHSRNCTIFAALNCSKRIVSDKVVITSMRGIHRREHFKRVRCLKIEVTRPDIEVGHV